MITVCNEKILNEMRSYISNWPKLTSSRHNFILSVYNGFKCIHKSRGPAFYSYTYDKEKCTIVDGVAIV